MKKSTLAMAVAFGVMAQQAGAAGFIEDSKASVSSRTLYFNNDPREGTGNRTEETATGLKFDYLSGFTQGTVGFGLDVQALVGVHLDGGRGHHGVNGAISPSEDFATKDNQATAKSVDEWTRLGANAKARFSKTELRLGNALAPNLPILVSNDGRLLPQAFEGGIVSSKEIDNVTLTAGRLSQVIGRASSNWSGMGMSGTGAYKDSNNFSFAGGDWKVTKDLTLQYYYANLEDFYKQHFLGLVHVLPLGEDQSFKTDLRYFNSSKDGKNGEAGYAFNNNGGYAKNAGEVDNQTWSAMFTYALGGHSLMVGHQQVGDDGGIAYMSSGNVTNNGRSNGRNEGNGGSSFYLFTDSMISAFNRAGTNTTFGQYQYDFARVGVPGLKAAIAYLHGDDIKGTGATVGREFSEWERDVRVDYVIQSGPLKGFGTTVRHGSYRADADLAGATDADQTRVIFNYTYAFK
ncbi:OprD family porin [Pseudomonas syringae group sp. J309-1]|uniref:OprD family porin n=1 Tax=Pseudomonas syringae group sp. J309-1 TaxID=3079588 RepID=UPI00290889A7|nr:OprD family porin [Pseudomonas syringae group sp. J309-1]MDU8360587.1 OprD family porin [Pseudomonas syringae group sp. J309-1]